MILDTNALTDYVDGNQSLLRQLKASSSLALPVIVLGEYRFGLRRSRARAERELWLSRFEKEVRILAITDATAHFYADIRESLRSQGRPIPENDIWIAALSLQHSLPVISHDLHFDLVEGLVRFGW